MSGGLFVVWVTIAKAIGPEHQGVLSLVTLFSVPAVIAAVFGVLVVRAARNLIEVRRARREAGWR